MMRFEHGTHDKKVHVLMYKRPQNYTKKSSLLLLVVVGVVLLVVLETESVVILTVCTYQWEKIT